MSFPFGKTVYRLRAKPILDPYSQEQIGEDWSEPDVQPIEGAFVAHTSTSMLGGATRSQALEAKSLYCGPADVRKGDKIRDGEDGAIYTIDGIPPASDTHPFTGWTPEREIPLTRAVG
ncbi:hypothetical protein [Microbacterium album]|uniref:Head-to-tail stopper n=1 Tax=Microbacterium album TaxID=2053191 RepID=A0A917ICF8_9MICO|nr:hypothetical protein [Microbacterium album]GGH34214.1 hypothetical protein GCM10010921_01740 [Microbacterium album]